MEPRIRKYAASVIPAAALVYSFFAGLRTVSDPDLGWQMATGRWIIQHRAIPSVDVLSYTAAGREWIYPAFSQVIFYCCYLVGGYSLLSWVSAAACIATIALMLRRGHVVTAILAIIAVPIIAQRTPPRAEMFSMVLFAAFVSLLWHYHRSGKEPLWLLPPLMVLWVNMHLGFISGLGMCGAYILLESEELLSGDRRSAALVRLRAASPWLLISLVATLVNPWGLRIYVGMSRLVPVRGTFWIAELEGLSMTSMNVDWRDPRSAVWWLFAAAFVAMIFAASRRRIAPVLILGTAIYACFHAVRFVGQFTVIAVVIGGSVLADGVNLAWRRSGGKRIEPKSSQASTIVAASALCVLLLFCAVRVADLVSNRFYLRAPGLRSLFGPGVAQWYPEKAAAFIQREHLPGNIYNEFSLGGFTTWRLSPNYPDYIDGRGAPFGSQLFFRSLELLQEPLDSATWLQEADRRGINTVLISQMGEGRLNLGRFCRSKGWRAVYLDTSAAVFVRDRPEFAKQVDILQVNCAEVQFDQPPRLGGLRGNAEQFSYYLAAASILNALGRHGDSLRELELAQRIFEDSRDLHQLKGVLYYSNGSPVQAESELRRALQITHSEESSAVLAMLYRDQGRYAEGAAVLSEAVKHSAHPHQLYFELGVLNLDMGLIAPALDSFDRAEKANPFTDEASSLGAGFNVALAEGREAAWSRLAEQYEARGLLREAQQARTRAASFAKKRESRPKE